LVIEKSAHVQNPGSPSQKRGDRHDANIQGSKGVSSMNARPNVCRAEARASAVIGCGPSLTVTDLWLCLLPVSFFLSIVSFV
jgi:hypothetical protein